LPVSATSVSADARAFARLIEEGSVPKMDMAIHADPSMLDVYVAEMGFILCHVTLVGKSAYFGIRLGSHLTGALERFCSRPFCGEYFTRVASIYLEVASS
jgi:hypothetical protein